MKKFKIITCPGSKILFIRDLDENKEYTFKDSGSYAWDSIVLKTTLEFSGFTDSKFPTYTGEMDIDSFTRVTYLVD